MNSMNNFEIYLLLITAARKKAKDVKEGEEDLHSTYFTAGYVQALLMVSGLLGNIDYSIADRISMFLKDDRELIEHLYGESYDNREKALQAFKEKYLPYAG